jgi:cell division protein FtsB
MKYSNKPTTASGTLRVSAFSFRGTVILIAAGVALMWAAVAFAQEAYISQRLSQQVSDLHRENSQIAAQNAGYRKDVEALSNGSADEEEARMSGFARPNERTFLVASPSPSPPAKSR